VIIGFSPPEGSKVIVDGDGRVLIVFDEKQTRLDLWKARMHCWVTEGFTAEEFHANRPLDSKPLILTHRNKLTQRV
jgi:hypothetical protein